MALVSLQGIEKGFGDGPLFRDVSMVIREGDRIGLVGPNGAGKSTLLKLIAGREEPDEGARTLRRGLHIAYLEQEPPLDGDVPVRTAIRGASHAGEHEIESLAHALGLDPDAPCMQLSGGERRRTALAHTLLDDPQLLLLDEPTNHLDAFVTAWLERRLLATKVPLVMVTHDRYFLDRIATRIIELDRGGLYKSDGGYGEFLRARAARVDAERKTESTRVNLLRREREWMRRGPQGRGTKAKARIRQYEALEDAAPALAPGDLDLLIPPGPHLGTKVIRLHEVCKEYCGLDKIDLEIGRGERVGIVGENGAGKTTLLRLCLGLLEPDAGRVEMGSTVKVAYVDQGRTELDANKSVIREIAGENVHVTIGERRVRIEGFLDRFLFPRAMHPVPVGDLSGGERNRVLLAKLLVEGGNVLALDEPTNDLDLQTLRALEEALLAFPGTVLVVSHDRWFLDRIATRILHVHEGGVRDHPGDMSSLLDSLEAERRPAAEPKAKRGRNKPTAKKPSYREKKELEALPDRIATAEEELVRLDAALGDPDFYTKPEAHVREVTARRKELADAVERLYRRWEELDSASSGGSGAS